MLVVAAKSTSNLPALFTLGNTPSIQRFRTVHNKVVVRITLFTKHSHVSIETTTQQRGLGTPGAHQASIQTLFEDVPLHLAGEVAFYVLSHEIVTLGLRYDAPRTTSSSSPKCIYRT
eukprot:1145257-Pelagomonas_calceolata.AAC.1